MKVDSPASPLGQWGFSEWLANARRDGIIVPTPELDGVNDAVVSIGGRKMINLSGIGILGWQHDPDVRNAFIETAQNYGLVVGGSRIVQGISRPHLELEELVASITGQQKALTFATGMLANVGLVNAMSARFSFDDHGGVDNSDMVLVLDRDSHWSMWKAAERFELGRTLLTFRHNDVGHLARVLARLRGRRVVVGFETVYSSDGSMAPVGEILDVCAEAGAVSFADDANGFMVYGNGGHRFAREYEALRRVTFLMVTFGKSVGLSGGALAGPADAIDAFRYLSGTSMFTTNLQPPTAGAIVSVLRRMLGEPQIMEDYLDRVDRLRQQLVGIGATISPTPTYITSILIGDHEVAVRVRDECFERGYLVPVFGYPAVKKNNAVIRLMVNNRLSDEDLDGFVAVLAELRQRYRF
jgi:5-aminolevulinate synthase/8-amino-7-oxononanoate synthase